MISHDASAMSRWATRTAVCGGRRLHDTACSNPRRRAWPMNPLTLLARDLERALHFLAGGSPGPRALDPAVIQRHRVHGPFRDDRNRVARGILRIDLEVEFEHRKDRRDAFP